MSNHKIIDNILPTDHLFYLTSDDTCSRCRRPLRDDEVPLRFWPSHDPYTGKRLAQADYMLVYCEDCSDDVLKGGDD